MLHSSQRLLSSRNPDLMPQTEEFVATGRRKTSVARIRMMPGSGKIDINGRSFEDYFPTVPLQNVVLQPLQTAKAVNAYDLWINASGGRAGGGGATGYCASAAPSRCQFAGHAEGGGSASSRSADEGTKKIRTTRRAEALSVLEALIGEAWESMSHQARTTTTTVSLVVAELAEPEAALPPEDAPIAAGLLRSVPPRARVS